MTDLRLEQAILKTIAWFSVFAYPLTVFEMWKWLYAPGDACRLADVYRVLASSERIREAVQTQDGFYCLAHQDVNALLRTRHERHLDAVKKYKKLRRAAAYFSLFPSVRAVAVGNTLSWWHTRPDSDIDLFIVTRPQTIWVTRLFLVLPFLLLGQRPEQGDRPRSEDTYCFSFFTTTEALNLHSLRLRGGDPYFAYWITSLVPILDRGDVLVQGAKENCWATEEVPHADIRPLHPRLQAVRVPTLPIPTRPFERMSKRVQMRKFPRAIREEANQDTRVIVSDQMLKFHANDRREQYRDQWRDVCRNINLV